LVVSGSYDRTVRVWNIDNGHCVRVFSGHTLNVYCALFSPAAGGARYIASCGLDTSVRVWDLEEGRCKATLNAHTSLVSQLVFTPTKLISGSAEGKITMFDVSLPDGPPQHTREGGTPDPTNDSDVKIQASRTIKLRSTPVNSLAVEDDFPFIVVGGGQGRISVVPHPIKDHPASINDTSEPSLGHDLSSPPGDHVDGSRFLHSTSNSPSSTRRISRIHKLAISPDGSRCIVGGDGRGGTYIEFWAFDRHRNGPVEKDAIEVDEKALRWHETDTTTPTGEPSQEAVLQAPPLPPPEEPVPMDLELLPIPGTADNPEPIANPQGGGLFTY